MSWSRVSTGSAVSTNTPQSTPLSVPYPASIVAGGILICMETASVATGPTMTFSDAGFSSIVLRTGNMQLGLWWKVATGTESGNFTITSSSNGGSLMAQCAFYTGGPASATSGNVHVTNTAGGSSGNNIPRVPAATITQPNCLVIAAGAKVTGGTGISLNGQFAAEIGQNHIGTTQCFVWDDIVQTTATSITADTWTISAGDQSLSSVGVVAALLPGISVTTGPLPTPGSPALSSPRNNLQFQGVGRVVGLPPLIAAAMNGLSVSSSVLYAGTFTASTLGFIPQPGPGSAGPFNNNQFFQSPAATSAPSPSTGTLFGLSFAASVLYGAVTGAGELDGATSVSASVVFGPGSTLNAGGLSGLAIVDSVAYGSVTGAGPSGGLSVSMSLAYMAIAPIPISPVTLPNLVGLEDQVAISTLQSLGLGATLLIASSVTIPEDFVTFQNPQPGMVPQGTNVTITISSGLEQFAGIGGSKWGAQGGGSAPAASPEPVLETLSKTKRQANYQITTQGDSVEAELSNTGLSGQTPDDNLPSGGNNSG